MPARRDGYLLVPPSYAASQPSPLLVLLHAAGKGASDAAALLSQQDVALLVSQRCLLLLPESRGPTWDLVLRWVGACWWVHVGLRAWLMCYMCMWGWHVGVHADGCI